MAQTDGAGTAMRRLRAALVRLTSLFRRERLDRELAAEMESHLQLHVDDNLRAGMSPDEARRQAIIALGGIEQTKEQYRDRLGMPSLEAAENAECREGVGGDGFHGCHDRRTRHVASTLASKAHQPLVPTTSRGRMLSSPGSPVTPPDAIHFRQEANCWAHPAGGLLVTRHGRIEDRRLRKTRPRRE